MYPPLSSIPAHSGMAVDFAIFRLHAGGISSLLGRINYISTISNNLNSFIIQIPIILWRLFITALLLLISLPVLASALTILYLERNFNTTFFDARGGGDCILFESLF
jgi:heme/copper-type cytochrome/quinol oxidase subunit 1